MNVNSRRRDFLTVFCVFAIFTILIGYCVQSYLPKTIFLRLPRLKSFTIPGQKEKLILVYTPFFGEVPWQLLPYGNDFRHYDGQPCEVRNCKFTYNKSLIDQSDAVLFHSPDMRPLTASKMKAFRERNPSQIWIWFMLESPVNNMMSLTPWDNFFNWTLTYRPSSDIHMPYVSILKYRPIDTPPKPGTNFAEGKTRKCLAMISNCVEFRMELIRNLKKYIDVDVLGACKNAANPGLKLDCPKQSEKCRKLHQTYKFYLAFENSYCEDYVTEKYYANGLQRGLVPVVLNGANFSNINVALPRSYINLLDFKDLKSLADYLHYLDKNDTAYNEYHQWRYNYRVNESLHHTCHICKSVWQQENRPKFSTVNLSQFWSLKTCRSYSEEMFQKYLR